MNQTSAPGRPDVFDIQSFVRKFIPFSQSPFRSGQKSGRGQEVAVTFATPNVDQAIPLALGHLPERYIVTRKTAACDIYDGSNHGSDWTPNSIVLRSTIATTVHLWVC